MIKLFEQFNNEQEIHDICRKYDIKRYNINQDGTIDIEGGLVISDNYITEIPIKINKVDGFIYLSYCENLTTLKNIPEYVGGRLELRDNLNLKRIDYFPTEIKGHINISSNNLTELNNIQGEVYESFNCKSNNITTLKGFPLIINGFLYLDNNPISIIDSSIEVRGGKISIDGTNFDDRIKKLPQDRLRCLFEHGVDYDIFDKNGTFHYNRLERMFKDFNI